MNADKTLDMDTGGESDFWCDEDDGSGRLVLLELTDRLCVRAARCKDSTHACDKTRRVFIMRRQESGWLP